ncbi:MAG: hypothetical protein M1827_001865 [Pycnora praestabilis]|nr:MAG: hypothetical protein M1827_001865 [Pycnora praestabilis]
MIDVTKELQINKLAAAGDLDLLCPIRYVYDYLPPGTTFLKLHPMVLPRSFINTMKEDPTLSQDNTKVHSIALYPEEANLPLHTELKLFRQSKHWKASEEATKELLQLFARDQSCKDIMLSDGQSMATLAEQQLNSSVLDSYSRFSIYMAPEADEKRSKLLAQSVVLIFIFDGERNRFVFFDFPIVILKKPDVAARVSADYLPDMWENASSTMSNHIRDDFVARLEGRVSRSIADTPLQKRMYEIQQGFLAGDEEAGNGGAEVLQNLIEFCKHQPPKDFTNVPEYLNYRFEDAANGFTWASTKFSIQSNVDANSPKLCRFLRHLGDQISIANDIASYSKEKQQYESGKATHMINIVDVIMRVKLLRDEVAAKGVAYAFQLEAENDILSELKNMKERDDLDLEEWKFVDACLVAAAGNLFTSVVISRYGGEKARIAE